MKKHTKEYADSLAEKRYPETGMDYVESWQTAMRHGFSEGYLKAIEENAVPELIEALKVAKLAIDWSRDAEYNEAMDFEKTAEKFHKKVRKAIFQIDNVLNKINQ